jgi:hypothetical protein
MDSHSWHRGILGKPTTRNSCASAPAWSLMNAMAIKTCYACDQPATTREHVPPLSFFPEGYRDDLITVPSCARHNNANSLDVEYTRNIISTFFGVNDIGQRHFFEKAKRSFERTPALLHTCFPDIRPVNVQGMQVGAFTIDVERIKAVTNACLTALHFRETGEKLERWEIVLPSMGFSNDVTQEETEAWRQLTTMISQLPFRLRATSSPKVFKYAAADIVGGRVYAMTFYEGFHVFGSRAMETDAAGT